MSAKMELVAAHQVTSCLIVNVNLVRLFATKTRVVWDVIAMARVIARLITMVISVRKRNALAPA